MAVQPKYHWQFSEKEGNIARDTIGSVEGRLHRSIAWDGHGRIGAAVRFPSRESRLVFGPEVGQFGTSDFTVAFGIKIMGIHDQNDLDIIGTRSMSGHGNWFSLRLQDKGRRLTFAVDENSKGKHHANTKTPRLSNLSDKQWHHIALVREGRTVKVYLDGTLVAEGASTTGVANINRAVDVKLGHYTRHTPKAHYEDLRIYHTALSAAQIQSLIPPVNRPLSAGEIELVATDGAAVVLTQDVKDLSRFSPRFQKLRLGAGTGARLYKGANFGGVRQKLSADIPDIRLSRLGAFPQSIQIRSTVGEPFTGKRVIKAPNGQYLSQRDDTLATASRRSAEELFIFRDHPNHDRPQLMPVSDRTLQIDDKAAVLLVDDSESHPDAFSVVDPSGNQWLKLNPNNTFSWTSTRDDRAIFFRAAKMADHEGQVGELAPGEVALYENIAYWGRTWILSDSKHDVAGNHTHFTDFHGLNDQTSSIRLGPDTGVTLFKHSNYRVANDKREEEIEDIIENVPDLGESQVGNDAISSIKIFQTIAPEDVFVSYTTKLSQDYRLVGNDLEEFSAYRTTLRFEPGAGAVEVSATDLTTVEVEGTTYKIDEARSVTLTPNELNFIMITSEADGLNTPGLKIRTSEMAENEQVVIFPNQEAHQQIAELEDDALWNAKDAQGNLIVDRTAHSQAEVASVQNTIKRVTATVTYANKVPVANPSGSSRVLSSERVVSGAAIDQPWELKFKPAPDEGDRPQVVAKAANLQA
ncbi:MAG: LamG domain-containing protein, partial [Cyanobacteria bacterium P01_G01_bin.38]